MGISYFIGESDNEYRIGSSRWYSKFLDRAAEIKDCPHLFKFTPDKGVASPDHEGPPTDNGLVSLSSLKTEIEALQGQNANPTWFEEMCESALEAINACIAVPGESLTIE